MADQDQHALELYRNSLVIDLLYQGPLGARDFTSEMSEQLKTIENSGHSPHLEEPDAVQATVRGFLDKALASAEV